ncbi:MAG: hypothetical protein WCL51_14630 [Bacteroidota bacterium]
METKLIIGNLYSTEEIENYGFKLKKKTSIYIFYRKDYSLLIFDLPKPSHPKLYKLRSIFTD